MDFIIEFKTSSQAHAAGTQVNFSSDLIQIGRDPECEVLFDDSTPTVSRKHAKIEREGNRFKVVSLSQTNATYINGVPVKDQYYLNSGDEIKLSSQGPVIVFKLPKTVTQSTATVSNVSSVQPSSPSKKNKKGLIAAICSVVLLAIVGVVVWFLNQKPVVQGIEECYTSVYYIKINDVSVYDTSHNLVFTYNTEDKISGTGFMLTNGKFVASRRVVEPWIYSEGGLVGYDQENRAWSYASLNALGYDIVTNCTAFTSAGTSFQFRNTDCSKNDDGNVQNDWVTVAKSDQLSTVPGLVMDAEWGNNPKYGTECTLLGYLKGTDVQDLQISSYANAVNVSELNNNEVIELSSRRWTDGMSGAPALILKDNRWVVIGILSNSHNSQRDIVVPIGNVLQ